MDNPYLACKANPMAFTGCLGGLKPQTHYLMALGGWDSDLPASARLQVWGCASPGTWAAPADIRALPFASQVFCVSGTAGVGRGSRAHS